jgi:hypothetical protein
VYILNKYNSRWLRNEYPLSLTRTRTESNEIRELKKGKKDGRDRRNRTHILTLSRKTTKSRENGRRVRWRTYLDEVCRRLETGGSLSRRVSVPRAPAQMGRARGRARRGEARWPETGVREVEIPRPSCSSRAQVGCACSRGLQASTRVREASGPKRAPVPSSSPRGQPSLRRPWSFLL